MSYFLDGGMMKIQENNSLSEEVAIFPLKTVVFPYTYLPLKVFEPRYTDLVSACLKNDTGFVISAILSGEEVGDVPEFSEVGTLVKIVDWDQTPDGLLGIHVRGEQKVQIVGHEVGANDSITGTIERMPTEVSCAIPAEFDEIIVVGQSLLARNPHYTQHSVVAEWENAVWASFYLSDLLPLSFEQKQTLLIVNDPVDRLVMLAGWFLD